MTRDGGTRIIAPAGDAGAALAEIREALGDPLVIVMPRLDGADDGALSETAAATAESPATVALLTGPVSGAALELSLAATARVAHADARLSFPGIAAGLPPTSGAAVRLTRLVGAPAALDLLLTARALGAAEARAIGLVDVVSPEPEAEARFLAGRLAADGAPARPPREIEPAMRAVARARKGATTEAARRIAACVEGALLLPRAAALEMERTARADLADGRESRGIRYAGMIDRAAEAGGPDAMGIYGPDAALALEAIAAGVTTTLCIADLDARHAAEEALAVALEEGIETVGAAETQARAGRITIVQDAAELTAPFILMALPEDHPGWRDAALTLADVAPVEAAFAASTVWRDPDALAQAAGREVVGWHRASRQLLELVARPGEALDAATGHAGRLSLRAVACAPGGPPPSLRLVDALRRAADDMAERGASPYAVDAAMRRAGFAAGPFMQADLEGHPFWAARRDRLKAEGRPRPHSHLADTMIEAGWTGRANGLGYYDWREGEPGQRPDVLDLLEGVRLELGLPAKGATPEDPARRCLLALVAEGARLVEEKVVAGPAEIDLVCLHALGFPRSLGGPMFWAAEEGLAEIARELFDLAAANPDFVPTALLLQSADMGAWLPG